MTHGTNSGYAHGCRCTPCTEARRDDDRVRYQRRKVNVDRKLLREVLMEVAPFGLTDDCPARRGQR